MQKVFFCFRFYQILCWVTKLWNRR